MAHFKNSDLIVALFRLHQAGILPIKDKQIFGGKQKFFDLTPTIYKLCPKGLDCALRQQCPLVEERCLCQYESALQLWRHFQKEAESYLRKNIDDLA